MSELRVYASVARLAFRRQSRYRGAMFASLFVGLMFAYLVASLLRAVVAERTTIDGWNAKDFVTYAFAAQSILRVVLAFGDRELGQRVLSGDIATDLARPVNLAGWSIAQVYGKAAVQFLGGTIPTFTAGFIVFDLRLPNASNALAAAVSLILALFVTGCFWLIVNLSAFWLLNGKGTVQIATIVFYVSAGIAFPLVMLPAWIEPVARWTPFASIVEYPVEVFLGKHATIHGLLDVYGRQLFWSIGLLVIAQLLIRLGRHRVVVHGG